MDKLLPPKLLLIDIDYTIANCAHREHLLPQNYHSDLTKAEKWSQYLLASNKDTPIEPMIDVINKVLNKFSKDELKHIFITGRAGNDLVREQTLNWLCEHGFDGRRVIYRSETNFRKASDYKIHAVNRYLKKHQLPDNFQVIIIDDTPDIIETFKKHGHTGVLVNPDNNYLNTVKEIEAIFDINPSIKNTKKSI